MASILPKEWTLHQSQRGSSAAVSPGFVFETVVRLEGIEPPALRSGGAGSKGAEFDRRVRDRPSQVRSDRRLVAWLLQPLLHHRPAVADRFGVGDRTGGRMIPSA